MDEIITLDYGSGGKKTARLIENSILPALDNPALRALNDGAVIPGAEQLVFSTDSFVVDPVFFPGGDIGKLAVCGTVNDIAMCGGVPKYLSCALILEEGFPMRDLERVLDSMRLAAQKAGVQVVMRWADHIERVIARSIRDNCRLEPPAPYRVTRRKLGGVLGVGCKMGEGWLLTAEMLELAENGFANIICAQPFGCLPNHIVGKGMIRRVSEVHPGINIVPIDYDPSATRVNQENRIRLMLAVARDQM
jgi:hypothetical protein